ncbi:MAG: hypothetical protein GXP55_04170 [Deltaproteobacteria bacterium]|nr:hypothetical protein [Deltaproteobacteria bacterium]
MGEPRTTTETCSLRELGRNQNGAMLIMGIFMATFVVAMLYYVAGIGETIVYRERMQDAADSGAMAGAVFLARGMNLIVMMNVTLASVFAVLVSAWTAFFLILSAAGIAASECNPPYRWTGCIPAICLLISLAPACGKIKDAEGIVSDVSSATQRVSNNAARLVPLAAAATVLEGTLNDFSPPANNPLAGIGVLGSLDNLPVENDPSPPVCDFTSYPWGDYNGSALSYGLNVYHAIKLARDTAICGSSYVNKAAVSALGWELLSCLIAKSKVKNKPKRVTNGAELGGDAFQFRALINGTPPYGAGDENANDRRVGIGTWGHSDDAGRFWSALSPLTRISFAQSEFYWDNEADRARWMWEFKWRARLRRFRPSDRFCSGAGSRICGAVSTAVVH